MKLRELSNKTEEGIWSSPPKFAVVNQNDYRIRTVCCYVMDADYIANIYNTSVFGSEPYKVMEIIDDSH